jgi:hypothetical protein
MAATATTVKIFTADQWAQRLVKLYPNSWTGDSAKVAGGMLYSLFESAGGQYNVLENGLEWVLNACRIATAEDVALDAIANDYFGGVAQFEAIVVRLPGESDTDFRARIYANLLPSGGTRADVNRVVELLTGQAPRICEPWNILDNGAVDSISFCDIDTVANPCRVGDQNLPMRYQGFVESILPSFGDQGNNPVYCADEGWSCDRSFIIDPQPTWFLGETELDIAINRVRMFGTIVWRKYGSTVTATYARGNTITASSGDTDESVSLIPPCSAALVVLACPGWNTLISALATDEGDFVISFPTAPSSDLPVDWIAAPSTFPGYGLLYLNAGATTASMAIPTPGQVLLATPSWNTGIWLTALESGSVSFEFDTAAPAGAYLNYGSFDADSSGIEDIGSGDTDGAVTFATPITNPYQLILLPGWDTKFTITKTSSGFTVVFATAPSADSFFYWGILDQPL